MEMTHCADRPQNNPSGSCTSPNPIIFAFDKSELDASISNLVMASSHERIVPKELTPNREKTRKGNKKGKIVNTIVRGADLKTFILPVNISEAGVTSFISNTLKSKYSNKKEDS